MPPNEGPNLERKPAEFKTLCYISIMKAIGFITEKAKTQMIPEDQLLASLFRENGITIFPMPWDEFDFNAYSKLDLAIFRTPWNYFKKLPDFLAWLKRLSSYKVPLHNPISMVQWNLDKSYLRDLQNKGAPILPTLFLKTSDFRVDIAWPANAPDSTTETYVLKPAISATADRTFKGDKIFLTDILTEENVYAPNENLMLQPFAESVVSKGEFSFLFFNGKFSHAVQKLPKANDFRVQNEHGGTWDYFDANSKMLSQAELVMKALGHRPLYARVDMVEWNGTLHLMELELFEPMLYVKTPDYALNFVRAVMEKLSS